MNPGLVERLTPGKVKLFGGDDVLAIVSQFVQDVENAPADHRLVSCHWETLRHFDGLAKDIVSKLADVSLALWPDWYGGQYEMRSGQTDACLSNLANHPFFGSEPFLVKAWVKAAATSCIAGNPPVVRSYPLQTQVSQLAKTISPEKLVCLLSMEETSPRPLLSGSFADTALWLAHHTGARIAVLVPDPLLKTKELEKIAYRAVRITEILPRKQQADGDESQKPLIAPFIGKPHPFSPGEQVLAKALSKDTELNGLFHFNGHIKTVKGGSYIADLVWPEGRVIVEVDGFRYHGHRHAFSRDRCRDYEMTVSGYLTLRLPHDEVVDDVALAVEKIRDVVLFRKQSRIAYLNERN